MNILSHFDVVPDHPKPGINFYDIQSVLRKPDVMRLVIDGLADKTKAAGADLVLGIESRGFLVGVPVAQKLGLPFSMVRKKGKLPGAVISQEYALEYGTDTIEIQASNIAPGMRVVILDDLLATGGTMKATGDLARKAGGKIALSACVLELHELGGRDNLDFPFEALAQAPLDLFKAKIPA
ncbi:MAG: adenine phosphoribosyltransferase [Alphaproteobacteria bacterium]|nr:adenine phosphoribosyltransferase [Alphaproteobacteria bacterium]